MHIEKHLHLKPDEKIYVVLRRFWPVFWWQILSATLLIIAPFFFLFALFRIGNFGLIIFWLALLFGLVWFIRIYFVWYFNAFVLTSLRLIDIDQKGFWQRTVSEAGYDKIQDVTYQLKGVWQTFFKYGKVSIQTAGTTVLLELRSVRYPDEVQQLITVIQQKFLAKRPLSTPASSMANELRPKKGLDDLTNEELKIIQTKIQKLLNKRSV